MSVESKELNKNSYLTLIQDLGIFKKEGTARKRRYGLYRCICGVEKEIVITSVRLGKIKSCGCMRQKMLADANTTHGLSKKDSYYLWKNIMSRCYCEKDVNFKNYGGKGICVCDDWKDVFLFCEWANNNGYKKGLQIDRINNSGNYEPNNCQFITHGENNAVGKKGMNRNNKSGYTGVFWCSDRSKWEVSIKLDYKRIQLGRYENIHDAVEARIAKEIELFGEQKTNLHYKTLDSD